ncbi:MAG: right-handed parallel beta-helix repeat-containing protein, partial [Sedimentisphaerales bacterium]
MKQIISKQLCFSTKNLLLLSVVFLLCNPGLSPGFYLLDTFDDDTALNPPNGPEIGTAVYAGSATHTVVNYGGDLRLHSADSDINGGISISYVPFASPDVVEVRYQILIESGGSLSGQNAFTQQMILGPLGTNIHMDWSSDHEWVFRISIPGPDPPDIKTGLTWVENTYYIINWYIDTVNDTFSVDMYDGMAGILGTTSISYNATGFNHMAFASSYPTTGSQRIDDVSIRRICGGPCTWYVDMDAAGGNNGQNWTDAFTRLQDALAMAAPGDKIKVAEGTYKPDQGGGQTSGDITATFMLIDDVVIEGGYAGFGEPDPNARDIEVYETILSGDLKGNDGPNFTNNADNSHHVVSANISGGGTVLDGFTVTAGNAVGSNPTGQGGGIYIGSGSPILANCTFIHNKAARGGGASNSNYGSDDPSFISCKFIGNSAGVGGAMESQGGEPSLTNCVLSGNTSTSVGGGLNNMGNSNATMTNCTLSGNSAVNGGGIFNTFATASIEVLNCILWSNSDSGGSDESAQIHIDMGTASVDYTCVQGLSGGLGGTGNIGGNPLFVDADGADDVIGTEDDDVHLLEDSPCIDAGHPAVEYQDIDGSRNDMGAYGGQFGEIYEPSVYTGTGFIITNIGDLPTTEIGQDANEPNVGLANVEPDVAALFGVPEYKD